jgi:hypothetical protein
LVVICCFDLFWHPHANNIDPLHNERDRALVEPNRQNSAFVLVVLSHWDWRANHIRRHRFLGRQAKLSSESRLFSAAGTTSTERNRDILSSLPSS